MRTHICFDPITKWLNDCFWQLVLLTEFRRKVERTCISICCNIRKIFRTKVNFDQQRSLLRLFLISQDFIHEERAVLRHATVVDQSDFIGVRAGLVVTMWVVGLRFRVQASWLVSFVIRGPDQGLSRRVLALIPHRRVDL